MFPKDEMLGFCSSCGTKIIQLGKKPKFLENYKEHFISLSNQTLMRIGVCDVCKVQLVAGDAKGIAKKILDNHKEYWSNHKVKTEKKHIGDRPKFYNRLTIENPNTSPKDFFRKLEKDARERKELNTIKKSYGMER
jgi:hypothetical protein